MKSKIFLFLFLFLFLISSVSAWSYDRTETYGGATAYAQVTGMYPECEGNKNGGYCVGTWYVDVSHSGDKFYINYQASDWGQSNENGFSGMERIADGRIFLEENGEVPLYILCAWDYDTTPNGDWAWAGICGGYLGTGYFSDLKTVNCYDNADCSNNYYCDKTGDWRSWDCKYKECDTGQEKCIWKDSYSCVDFVWSNDGLIKDKCGVQCIGISDCPESAFVGDKFCSSIADISKSFRIYECINNGCAYTDEGRLIETCGDICENGDCTERGFIEKNIVVISIVGFLILLILTFYILRKKKK